MAEREIHDMIRADIADLAVRISKLHTPLDCPLRRDIELIDERVRRMQLREAWRSGVWATIGGLVALGGFSGIRALF